MRSAARAIADDGHVAFVCSVDETQQEASLAEGVDDDELLEPVRKSEVGIRTLTVSMYEVGRMFFDSHGWADRIKGSVPQRIRDLASLLLYSHEYPRTGRRKKIVQDIDALVEMWTELVTGMCLAHDKDDIDRYEARVEECLRPILQMPVRQVREFGPKLVVALKSNRGVPYLVWRAYEVWIDQMKSAPDEGIKELKTQLAREIVDMVEPDVRGQLPDAMVRALQWRSPETLEKVKETVVKEKEAGRKPRMRGRESCLFLEIGGTEEKPEVCVQL